jgi:hypothetical protein
MAAERKRMSAREQRAEQTEGAAAAMLSDASTREAMAREAAAAAEGRAAQVRLYASAPFRWCELVSVTHCLAVHAAHACVYGCLDGEGVRDEHLVHHVLFLLLLLPLRDLAPQLLTQSEVVQLALQRVLHVV